MNKEKPATYSNVSKWGYAFYIWLKRNFRTYQNYLDLYGTYEPERVAFDAMLALAED